MRGMIITSSNGGVRNKAVDILIRGSMSFYRAALAPSLPAE